MTQLPAFPPVPVVCAQEAELARGEAQRMASLADSEAQRCLALEREMVERMEESGGSGGLLTQQALTEKDRWLYFTENIYAGSLYSKYLISQIYQTLSGSRFLHVRICGWFYIIVSWVLDWRCHTGLWEV